jgi:cytochrome c biogenesis factor
MMNMLNRRLLNAALSVSAMVLVPSGAFAQDAAVADNASGYIGILVIWLLAVGGAIAIFAMVAADKRAQASRNSNIRR